MFRTAISHIDGGFEVTLEDTVLSLGSCFAAHMGNRLSLSKFKCSTNPLGVIFNPLSIFELLNFALDASSPLDSSYLERQGVHFNYKLHSQVNANSKTVLKHLIESSLDELARQLKNTDVLILTFGTAWIYELNDPNMIVANCHKVPQSNFSKRLLSVDEIVHAFSQLKEQLYRINPQLRIVITVSPIRHTKEGLSNNSLSKSVLRLACHEIIDQSSMVDYFPAYEILMDDLRDYRFYEKDMIHPNDQAQDYVWEKFCQTYFSDKTLHFRDQWTEISKALNHTAFNPKSDQHQAFLQKTMRRLENLTDLIDVEEEMDQIRSQIIS